jgi:PBP1b-binding outer membrane lipoprotein LpoB
MSSLMNLKLKITVAILIVGVFLTGCQTTPKPASSATIQPPVFNVTAEENTFNANTPIPVLRLASERGDPVAEAILGNYMVHVSASGQNQPVESE